jgi:arsenate reductase (glutaredoxin)
MYTLYGIPNCDSVKKARVWLDKHNIPYEFHDYKQSGITKTKLNSWSKQLGWENVFNKNSTTFKELPDAERDAVTSQAAAVDMMVQHNSIIKRPLIEKDDKVVAVRFNETVYEQTFL